MQDYIEHKSGIHFSVKTFRPLFIFPWLTSVNRVFPMACCMATISYTGKQHAKKCHAEIVKLLTDCEFGDDMSVPVKQVERYAGVRIGAEIRSIKVYPLSGIEGNLKIRVADERE